MTGARTQTRLLAVGSDFAGRYRIDALLGEGGTGAVYRALEVAQNRQVALEVIAPELVHDETALARFRREVDLLQRLDHPNVVRLYDAGRSADGSAYVVLELVRRPPLSDLLRTAGPLPLARVCRIATQILKGLMAAHALGIVHRDIEPSNICVGDIEGQTDFVTIVGFGLATQPEQTGLTRAGVAVGTPAYMAPEQALGGRVTAATDLYSVGLLVAEMLSGRRVNAPDTSVGALVSPGGETSLPAEATSSALGPILERATHRDPSKRPASAAEMLAAIAAAASQPPPRVAEPFAVPQQATAPVPFRLPFQPYIYPRPVDAPPRRASGCGIWVWIVAGVAALACAVTVGAAAMFFAVRQSPAEPAAQPGDPAPAITPTVPSPDGTEPVRDAGPTPNGLPAFNRAAADAAVRSAAAAAAQSCNRFGAPFGSGEAIIAFLPSGAAKGTPTANHANNQVRTCMESTLKSTRVAPFSPGGADPVGRASFNLPANPQPSPSPAIPTPAPFPAPTPTPSPIPKR
jgi:hypothetical protein